MKSFIVGSGKVKLRVTHDADRVEAKLLDFADRLTDVRRFWRDFYAPQWFNDILENFQKEGRLVGTGWRRLSPRYAAYKARVVGNKPILQFTGRMRDSFVRGNVNNVSRMTKTGATFGSRIAYVRAHNEGDGVPQRRIIFTGPARVYRPLLSQFLAEEMRAAGLKSA